MPTPLKMGYKALLAEAEAEVESIEAKDAIDLAKKDDVVIVDIRDPRELERDGKIPGSFHATRGMLEFWVDPESPYFKPVFGEDKTFVIHCASGWRSLLATQQLKRMGLPKVVNMRGGFSGWKQAGGPVAMPEKKG